MTSAANSANAPVLGRKASVVIVTWNSSEVLQSCLESIATQDYEPKPDVIVADNASLDDTASIAKTFGGRVQLIELDRNLGFAAANNLAAKEATGDRLLFLNPDTRLVRGDTLRALLSVLDDPSIGLAGPGLLNLDGTRQLSAASFPTATRALVVGAGLHRVLPDSLRARFSPVTWSQAWPEDTDWLRGAALAIPAVLFHRLGGFSERTFMYGEDLDLAYRVRLAGYRVRYDPRAEILHYDDHSSSQRWSPAERARRVAAGDVAFLTAHFALPRRVAARFLWGLAWAGRAVVLGALGRRGRAGVYRAMAEETWGRHQTGT